MQFISMCHVHFQRGCFSPEAWTKQRRSFNPCSSSPSIVIYHTHYTLYITYLRHSPHLVHHTSNHSSCLSSLVALSSRTAAQKCTMPPLTSPHKSGSRHRSTSPLPPPLPPKAIDLNSSTRSTDRETGSKVTRRAFLCDVVVEREGEGSLKGIRQFHF